MILVCVGSYQFDALVEAVDRLRELGAIKEPVTAQTAHGKYRPRHCEHFRWVTDLSPYYESARLVIAHGGTGITLEVLSYQKPLISVSNPALADNHQHEFLAAMAARNWLVHCRDLHKLAEAIEQARSNLPQCFTPRLVRGAVVADLTSFLCRVPARCR